MFGPSWDHVWPSYNSRPAISLKFATLDLHDLRPISIECPFFGNFQDHVGTMIGLALLPDQLGLSNFKTWSRWSKAYVYEVHALTMLKPCLA